MRIIATAPSNAEIICALGACDRIVAVSPFTNYPAALRDLPKVGGIQDPDLEAIVALRPDLLVLRGDNVHVERLCAEYGIRLYRDRTDSLPSLFATIDELGKLLDRRDEARQVGESLQATLDEVRRSAEQRPKVRVLLTLRSPDRLGELTTVSRGSYLHTLIELAGGDNVFGDLDLAYPQVGLEDIMTRAPEVIIEAMPGVAIDASRRNELMDQWRAIGTLEAAQRGRIYYLTEDYVLVPSPRIALLAERLLDIFAIDAVATEK